MNDEAKASSDRRNPASCAGQNVRIEHFSPDSIELPGIAHGEFYLFDRERYTL